VGEKAKELQQCEIYYSGRVQGVGFRYTARALALRFEVTGFVRNVPDGRVQMVVEGSPPEIQRFIEAIGVEMRGYIRDAQQSIHPATGRFRGFEIRF
jgi:acylphosphatase